MKKEIFKKYVGIVFGAIVFMNLFGCTTGSFEKEFCYGVISSYEQDSDSKLLCFDEKLNLLSERKIKTSNIGGYWTHMPIVLNNHVYEISLGQGVDKDNCAIISIDLETGELQSYPFSNRVNITDFEVTEKYIYAISNLNGQTYIDRYSFEEQNTVSYIVDMIGVDMCLSGKDLYLFVNDTKTYKMYQIDIDNQKAEEVLDLTSYYKEYEAFGIRADFQESIYIPHGNEILKYTKKDEKLKEIPLVYGNAYGVCQNNSTLYVSCTDLHDSQSESDIVVLNMDTDEILQEYHIGNSIEQFWVVGDKLIVLGQDSVLYTYNMQENNVCMLENKKNLGEQGYDFLSALFVREIQ